MVSAAVYVGLQTINDEFKMRLCSAVYNPIQVKSNTTAASYLT